MTLKEIRAIALKRGIDPQSQIKKDLIKTLQSSEGNQPCYATGTSDICGQDLCLWRADCTKADRLSIS
ncbi:SAP domain-containing protein [Deltaproteobacteria bacterium TL4]